MLSPRFASLDAPLPKRLIAESVYSEVTVRIVDFPRVSDVQIMWTFDPRGTRKGRVVRFDHWSPSRGSCGTAWL
jgi:hypothetical protein